MEPQQKKACLESVLETPPPSASDLEKSFDFSENCLPPTPGNFPDEEELEGFELDPFNTAFDYGSADSSFTSLESSETTIESDQTPDVTPGLADGGIQLENVLQAEPKELDFSLVGEPVLEISTETEDLEELEQSSRSEDVMSGGEEEAVVQAAEPEGGILDESEDQVVPELEMVEAGIVEAVGGIDAVVADEVAPIAMNQAGNGFHPAPGAVRISTLLPIILGYRPVPVVHRQAAKERPNVFPTALISYGSKYFGQVRCAMRGYSGFKERTITSFYDGAQMIVQKFPEGRIRVLRNYTCVTIQHRANEFQQEHWTPEAKYGLWGRSRVYPTDMIPRESTYFSGLLAGSYMPAIDEPPIWIHRRGCDGVRTNFKLDPAGIITVERDEVQRIIYQ